MQPQVDLLRLSTAGSVDDGKSTLIGRLLLDTKSIFEDQYNAVAAASKNHEFDLALLTDGLRAEREQGITIDVAYRYFSTPKRKFIIADTPGHVQYTRNMVTGASSAELAIILIDARHGVITQSKRHAFIASLLQVPHIAVVVNKMDLVGYDEAVYQSICTEFRQFAERLSISDLVFIPASALLGDNVVEKSANMDWYDGPTLLHHLETVSVRGSTNMVDFRFPVQYVVRPHQDFRGFAGQVASGIVRPGDRIAVLPSGQSSSVQSIETFDGPQKEARPGEAVVLTLSDEIDISRGDMIVREKNLPTGANQFECTLCWMDSEALDPNKSYLLRHTTKTTRAFLSELSYRINVDTLHREKADSLALNEIGRATVTSSHRLFFDPYNSNRETGCFVLIDPTTKNTAAAGMIRKKTEKLQELLPTQDIRRDKSKNVVWQKNPIDRSVREKMFGHKACVLWMTGLSGSGKTTIARAIENTLFYANFRVTVLDGDNLRHGLNGDLGFSAEDRKENIRRSAEVARVFYEQGHIVLCTLISPFAAERAFARQLIPADRFFEVFVDAGLSVCQKRDPKGLYKKVEQGEITEFTGISSPYEAPQKPELHLDTEALDVTQAAEKVVDLLRQRGIVQLEPEN